MKLSSTITVSYNIDQVWNFLKDPINLAKWDKNVDKVILTSNDKIGLGYTFITIASKQPGQKKGAKMSYRIIEYVPANYAKILLTNSRIFKKAIWTFRVKSLNSGTMVSCEVDFTFSLGYLYLIPVLLFSKRGKLLTDLEDFELAIKKYYN